MKKQIFLAFAASSLLAPPAVAQTYQRSAVPADLNVRGASPGATTGAAPGYGYGYNPYQTTTGFYSPTVGNINYPSFGMPVNIGGNYYRVPSGSTQLPMWKAPSGYYYPWCPRPVGFTYAYPMPVLIINSQQTSPAPALPPISTVITDMDKYLEDAKKDGKISDRDYTNMSRRVKDLKSKERTMRIAGGDTLDPADETQIRTELDQVGSELSWRLNR